MSKPRIPPATDERAEFVRSADEYCRWLWKHHPEHFMESTDHAQQRLIFVSAFDVVRAENPLVHPYNELLIQWRRKTNGREIRKVVPDNMVVLSRRKPDPKGSYDLPFQPAPPFWVLEYVSKQSGRKDDEFSFDKYEQELEVPYYLVYYHDAQEMSLYRHDGRRYVSVKPNARGRCAIPEIEVEAALLDDWTRFWHRGELLPLPCEMHRTLRVLGERAEKETLRADDATRRADALQAELDRLRRQFGG